MEKMIRIVAQHYNKETDEIEWLINSPVAQPAISIRVDDELYLRVHPETREIVGATLFHASEWLARRCPYAPKYPLYKRLVWIVRELWHVFRRGLISHPPPDPEIDRYMEQLLTSLSPSLQSSLHS